MSKEPIPGERDTTTAAPTEAGIVGTTGYGVELSGDLAADSTLSEKDHQQSRWEGGGRAPHKTTDTERTSQEEDRGSQDATVRREEGAGS